MSKHLGMSILFSKRACEWCRITLIFIFIPISTAFLSVSRFWSASYHHKVPHSIRRRKRKIYLTHFSRTGWELKWYKFTQKHTHTPWFSKMSKKHQLKDYTRETIETKFLCNCNIIFQTLATHFSIFPIQSLALGLGDTHGKHFYSTAYDIQQWQKATKVIQ